MLKDVIVKLLKTKRKEEILKAANKKKKHRNITFKEIISYRNSRNQRLRSTPSTLGVGWVGSILPNLEFYTQGKYSQKQDKDNFRLTKTEKLLLPENPH